MPFRMTTLRVDGVPYATAEMVDRQARTLVRDMRSGALPMYHRVLNEMCRNGKQ